ncbi:MAG: redoxin family protein [Candidatus Liptonbacteria bacterium]|nr:redoxin family protein [Candidatus Liptonbacteria bacterium]
MTAKSIVLVLVLAATAGAIFYLESLKPDRAANVGSKEIPSAAVEKQLPRAKEIVRPAGYINTPLADSASSSASGRASAPITIGELIGKKVILVDFWTFSCINCQRTTPYLNAWYEKYKGKGLEIVGVHTPEFPFEEKYENVKAAVEKAGIRYPVVLDNEYATWTAYGNRFWPRKYLIDIDGYIVYDHIGEGAYDETERKIQELLEERTARLNLAGEIAKDTARPTGTIETDFTRPRSPEIYFGAARNASLGNGAAGTRGIQSFSAPETAEKNILYLAGSWDVRDEFAENREPGAKIIFRYEGKDLYFVAGAETPIKIKIFRDGKPLGVEAGADVKREGGETYLTVQDETLYRVIEDDVYEEHTVEFEILSPGVRAYTFTFG